MPRCSTCGRRLVRGICQWSGCPGHNPSRGERPPCSRDGATRPLPGMSSGRAVALWRLAPSGATGRRHPDARGGRHGTRRRIAPTSSYRLDPMLVAVRSIEATFHGQAVPITAGRDHVRASHWIARTNPDAFKPPKEGPQWHR